MGVLKPARAAAAASQQNEDVLCDLDAIVSETATFTFQGKTHVLLPVTTQRFMDFWDGMQKFERLEQKTADEVNAAFLGLLKSICEDVTLEQVAAMTVVQKSTLLKALAAKVVGNKGLFDSLEKKNSMSLVMTQERLTG